MACRGCVICHGSGRKGQCLWVFGILGLGFRAENRVFADVTHLIKFNKEVPA